mgnify:CR=1 FL=1|jgi:hypothetical protein
MKNKVCVTLDENKQLDISIKKATGLAKADEAEVKLQEMLGNKLEVIQLGNDIYMYLNGESYKTAELI